MPNRAKSKNILKKKCKKTKSAPLAKITITPLEVQTVANWIIEGHSQYEVEEAVKDRLTDNPKKIELLFQAVLEHFSAAGDADPQLVKGWALESMRQLYKKMMEIGDYTGAFKVAKYLYSIQK
tara:strand:- start:241 stop:609 length:369 start_codon:yes stop_codon:yes gene_type:complete